MAVALSVVVPIYNSEKYLHKCIDSIIGQTFANMEIILVDNVSTDNSGKICDTYAQKDGRIKVIHRKEHGWVSDSRNEGIAIASGKWITFIDSDDWLDLDYIETIFEENGESEADIICGGGRWLEYPRHSVIRNTGLGCFDCFKREEINLLCANVIMPLKGLKYASFSSPWDKFYRTDFIKNNHLQYGKEIYYMDDVFFNFVAFCKASRIVGCSCVGYHYRQVMGSIIHSYDQERPNKAYCFLEKLNMEICKNGKSDIINAAFQAKAIWSFCDMLKGCCFHDTNIDSYSKKKAEIKKWKQQPLYKEAIYFRNNAYLGKKHIIVKWILRTPFIFPLALLVKAQNSMKGKTYG